MKILWSLILVQAVRCQEICTMYTSCFDCANAECSWSENGTCTYYLKSQLMPKLPWYKFFENCEDINNLCQFEKNDIG